MKLTKVLIHAMVLTMACACATTDGSISYTVESEPTLDPNVLQQSQSVYPTTTEFIGEAWYDQHQVFSINELSPHASMEYYDSLDDAILASDTVLDEIDQSISSRYIDLNGSWSFYYVDRPTDRLRGYTGSSITSYTENWDTIGWDTLTVPHCVQTEKGDDGEFVYQAPLYINNTYPWLNTETIQYGGDGLPVAATSQNGVGHYKREFIIDSYDPNQHYILHFDGVASAFYVYINGQCIGYSEDSYGPSDFDITPYIHQGSNTIALEVYQYADGSYLENQDMIRLFGIFRDVSIIQMGSSSVYDIETHISYGSSIDMKVDVTLYGSDGSNHELKAYLVDTNGQTIASASATYTANASMVETTLSFDDLRVHLWNIDDPYLYRLITVVDDQSFYNVIRIGFRELSWDDSTIYINGHATLLNGINRHEMDPDRGKALTHETIIQDLQLIQSLNINAIRLSHYPNDPLTYDVADELGLLLIDEANIESHGGEVELGIPGNNPAYTDQMVQRIDNMIERDINHPSIIIWSYGNESTYSEYALNDDYGFYVIAKHVLKKDPTRLRMYERDNRVGKTRETSMVDIASSQYLSIDEMVQMNAGYDIPYLQQEYAHAMGNGLGNFKEYMDAILDHQIAGGFVWDFADQSITTCQDGVCYFGNGSDWGQVLNDGNFCGNGIVSADRSLQSEALELKAVYSPIEIKMDDTTVTLTNHYPTQSLNGMILEIITIQDGTTIHTQQFELDCAAGKSCSYTITPYSDGHTTIIQAYVYTKDAPHAQWIAFEQLEVSRTPIELKLSAGNVEVEQGDGTITLSSADGSTTVSFDTTIGILTTFDVNGSTIFTDSGYLQLYRAPIDNDPLLNVELIQHDYPHTVEYGLNHQEDGSIRISFDTTYTSLDISTHTTYTFNGSSLLVDTTISTGKTTTNGPLPLVGTKWHVDPSYDTYTYQGYGQYDHYTDRRQSAIYGTYTQTIGQYQQVYLTPQTSEHKLDVDHLALSDGSTTICFTMVNPLGFTYETNDPLDIANASHWHELIPNETNTLILDAFMRGVGNGSNGPQTLDQYCVQENTDYHLQYLIEIQ